MFKKLALFILIAATAFSFKPSVASERKQLNEKVKMKAFLCYYFECPAYFMEATGLNAIIEMYGSRRAMQVLSYTQSDARFFENHVIMTEPGKDNGDIYKRMMLKIRPTDYITLSEVRLNTKGRNTLDFKNGEGASIKINNRPLISKELAAAHSAAQSLIYEGVLKAPQNEYNTTTDAAALNKIFVDFNKDR